MLFLQPFQFPGGAPIAQDLDIFHQRREIGDGTNCRRVHTALSVEVARRALRKEHRLRPDFGQQGREPGFLCFGGGFDFGDALFDAMRNQPAGMFCQFAQQMREIDRDPALQLVKDQQIGKAARQHAVQRGGSLRPGLGHGDTAPPMDFKTQFGLVVRADLKARRKHDAIDRIADSAHHDRIFGDPLNAMPFGIDQLDIGPVERGQVLIVEARPFAHEPIPGLKSRRRLWVFDDTLNTAT